MKRTIRSFIIFVIILVLLGACNTPINQVLNDSKRKNTKDYASAAVPLTGQNSNGSVGEISKDAIKAVSGGSLGTLSDKQIDSLYSKPKEDNTQESGKPFYSYFEKKQKDFNTLNHVEMAYNAAPLEEIVPVFAKILDFNFYIDPRVKGTVTMSIDSDLSKKDLWMVFEQILLYSGAYCSLDQDVVHILPLSMMPQERRLGSGFAYEANVSVVLFHLKSAKSSDVIQQIKPFVTSGATLIDIPSSNSFIVVETPSNMPKLETIISMLDTPARANWPKAVIQCDTVPASKVASELAKIFPVLGLPIENISPAGSQIGPMPQGAGNTYQPQYQNNAAASSSANPGAIQLIGLDRIGVLVVSAATPDAITEVKKWVDVLDRNDIGEQDQVYIYNVINADADDLVQTLAVLFNVQGATLTPSQPQSNSPTLGGSGGATPGGSSGGSQTPPTPPTPPAASLATAFSTVTQIQSSQNTATANQPKETPMSAFDVPAKIMADKKNQRLVIRTAPRTYAIMKAVLAAVDTIPAQVVIRIIIADVDLSNEDALGVEYYGKFGSSQIGNGLLPTSIAQSGFSYLLNTQNGGVNITALQSLSNTTFISAPEILVQNNTQAYINIGQQVSVSTGSMNTPGQAVQTTSYTYTYMTTGVIISVTPHITRGNMVGLDYSQTYSDFTDYIKPSTAQPNPPNPTIIQRVLNTTFDMPDRSTILIGGLIQEKGKDSGSYAPFLANIPIIKYLFGSQDSTKQRTELLVLLTAEIQHKTNDIEKLAEKYKNAVKLMKDLNTSDHQDNNIIYKSSDSLNKTFISPQ